MITPTSRAVMGEVFLRGRRPSDPDLPCSDCGQPHAEWISDPTEWRKTVIAYCASYVAAHRD